MINNQPTKADYVIKNGDLISNVLHRYATSGCVAEWTELMWFCPGGCRHEPPVVAGPIRIIYDGRLPGNDGQTLVIEKPGSMPVSKSTHSSVVRTAVLLLIRLGCPAFAGARHRALQLQLAPRNPQIRLRHPTRAQ